MPNFGEISIDLTEEKLKVKLDYNFYHKKNIRCKIEDYELAKLKKVNKKTLFYSGGLDSTILAIVYGSNIDNYYATGFNFEECDLIEKNYAITGAEALGIDLKFKEYDFKKLLLLLPEAIFYSQSTLNHIQTLLLYKLMKDLKFSDDYILNGQGADAIFGTYAQYKFYNSLQPNIMTEKFIKNICCDYSNTKSKEFYVCKYNEHDSQLNKNFYLDITGDCDLTIISWSMLAKKCKKTIIFPFYTQKNYNFVKNFEWNDRVCEPKHILREYGKKLNVPDEIIYRSKASFGPVSTGWFEEILLLFPLCSKFKNIDEQLIKKVENRYCLWNLINISIWSMLFLDNIPINDVKLNIKELLSYDK